MKHVVYTASPESQQIHVWLMDKSGELSLLQVVEAPGQVQPMVVSPDGRHLHVGVRPQFRVVSYAIDEQGKLTHVSEVPLPGSPTHLSTDHSGGFLFCAFYHDGCVSISPIDASGLPQPCSQVIDGLAGCHSANIDLSNQTLFVPALKQDRICLYNLHDNGKLTPAKQPQVMTVEGAGPRHMAFHPNRHYAYCINELGSTVDVWLLHNSGGQVERVQSLDMMPVGFSATRWAADIHLTPDGRFLYSCDRTASVIAVFSVSEDGGLLTLAGHQPTETQPRGFNISPDGKLLVAAGQKSDSIAVYKISSERGLLQPLGRYAVGKGPMWVVINALK